MSTLVRRRRTLDIWPGFVDALATLLMVIIFLIMVFVLAQFYLTNALSGRDEALHRLQGQITELADLLALERKANADLRLDVKQLGEELQASVTQRDDLGARIEALMLRAEAAEGRAERTGRELEEAFKTIIAGKDTVEAQRQDLIRLSQQVAALQALKEDLEKQARELGARLGTSENELASTRTALVAEQELSESARAQIALANRQMAALREQLAQIAKALEASEKQSEAQKVEIASLGRRLNAALASKVQELSHYRSEFFGRLREVLGNHPGIRIVGDRFVFQSEVLFDTGSAEIGPAGQEQMARLAETVRELARTIPVEINWILRIDGHTDKVPIATARFPSNWELSSARAISVVRFLIAQGIPSHRLAAAGFGEYQPIDPHDDEIALRRNRRIELKLDQL